MRIDKQGPRDPADLTDADLPTMSDAERAEYYYANRNRLDELFDDEPVEFAPAKGAGTVISVRLQPGDLRELEYAAALRKQKLSTFIREAALTVAKNPGAHVLKGDEEMVHATLREAMDAVVRLQGLWVATSSAQVTSDRGEPESYR